MASRAASFEVRTQHVRSVGRAVAEARSQVTRPTCAFVFASGSLAEQVEGIADAIHHEAPGLPVVVSGAAGVLTERGQVEAQAAATGLVFGGADVEVVSATGRTEEELGESLARHVSDRSGRRTPTAVAFVRLEGGGPGLLEPLRSVRGSGCLFGAGTLGPGVALVADGAPRLVPGAIAFLRGLGAPHIVASPAGRLLAPLRTITSMQGSLVLEIDGEPALDVLGEIGPSAEGQLLFAVLAEDPALSVERGGRPEVVLRGVQGVDPSRRGFVISDEARTGMRLGFAVRDAAAAKADLDAVTRELSRATGGAAPAFGLYLDCAGRGTALYGAPDVDTRLLKARWPALPFAGMQSSFEIAPHAGRPALHLFTGVWALFSTPS